ncbi:MAG: metallophosphoesterase [Alistipes sp.]|nr:metallophosphoesterase [Alistipes sp.]
MRLFFLSIMAAYLLGNGYISFRAWQFLTGQPLALRLGVVALIWVAALALMMAMMLRHAALPAWLGQTLFTVGSSWMVITLYLVLSLLVVDLLRLCGLTLRFGFVGAVLFTTLLLVVGYINHRHPMVVHIAMQTDRPIEGGAVRIAFVSDVHLGEGTGRKQLERYVRLINQEQPDLILITGDLIDNSITPLHRDRMHEPLNALTAPLGIYMVAGNHEYISDIEQSKAFLEITPITLLQDSVVTLNNGVQLLGRDDRSNRHRKPLDKLAATATGEGPRILLDHQPYHLQQTDSLGLELQLSGHTHHGQVWPMSLLTDHLYEQSHGYRRWSNSHIYVSSGLSLWGPPFRIGTRGELVIIRLYN